MDRLRSRFSYPVFLDLGDVPVLVVGAGRIGARKADGLRVSGARVRVVATEVSAHLDVEGITRAGGEIRCKAFDDDDMDGIRLVVSATGDEATDAHVSAVARARGIWVNAADQPTDCDFILPAIVRAGRVTGAISTDGASPALAGHLRDRLAEFVNDATASAADELAAERAAMKARGVSTESVDWRPRIAELLDRSATS
jgi:siroheme synthase-like protein